jgi:hypothetical protein
LSLINTEKPCPGFFGKLIQLNKEKFIVINCFIICRPWYNRGLTFYTFKYVHSLEAGKSIKFFSIEIAVRNELMLAGVSVIFMVLLILGAGILLFAKSRIDRLMLDFGLYQH